MLFEYLTHSSVSLLRKALVDTDDAHCSDVSAGIEDGKEGFFHVTFEGVPVAKMPTLKVQCATPTRAQR